MPRPLLGRCTGLATPIALAAACLACAPAWGAPAPGCAGTAFTDPSGDAVDGSLFVVDQPAAPNLDVLSGFFNDDAGTVTANIQVANLSNDVPATATGVDWYMVWTDATGAQDYVRASVEPGGEPVFAYGTVIATPTGGALYQDTDVTAGQFFPGPNGIAQIAVPPDLATGTLAAPNAQTYEEQNAGGVVGRLLNADSAPDDGGGQDYAVGGCATTTTVQSTAAPAPAGGSEPPSSSPPAGQAPGSSAPSSTSDSPRTAIRVTARGASARAANRSHALRVGITSNVALSAVKGVLRDGRGRTVATGSLSRLEGRGTLRLRVRRALRKGRYTLRLTGRDANGATATKTAHLTLAR